MNREDARLDKLEPFILRSGSKENEYLNPDFAYALWAKLGSVARAAKYLADLGIKSYNGKPYTRQGIHLAAKHSSLYAEAKSKIHAERRAALKKIK